MWKWYASRVIIVRKEGSYATKTCCPISKYIAVFLFAIVALILLFVATFVVGEIYPLCQYQFDSLHRWNSRC